MLACAVTIVGLELLYRHTLVGHAFLAIAEDNYAARALGLPERNLRMASFALAGVIGALAGFAGGQMLLAFFANAPMLNFYGFVPVALGGMGNNRGAVVAGLIARPVPAGGELPGRRHLRLGRGVRRLHHRPAGMARGACRRRDASGAYDGDVHRTDRGRPAPSLFGSRALERSAALPDRCSVIGLALPLFAGGYWGVIAQRACIYWVLVGRPEPGGGLCRPARHRLGGAADARRLHHAACWRPATSTPALASLSRARDRGRASARCSA